MNGPGAAAAEGLLPDADAPPPDDAATLAGTDAPCAGTDPASVAGPDGTPDTTAAAPAGGPDAAPPKVPRLALPSALAPVWNAALSFAGAPIPLAGQARAVFQPASPPPPGVPAELLFLGGEPGGAEVLLCPTHFPFAEAFGADISLDDLGLVPLPLATALRDGVRDVWLRAADGALTLRPAGRVPVGEADPEGACTWFEAVLEGMAPAPCRARIGVRPGPLAAWLAVEGRLGRPRVRYPDLAARVTLRAIVSAGSVRLRLAELRALEPGDVLLAAAGAGPELPQRHLVLAQGRLTLEARPEGWTVLAHGPAGGAPEDLDPMTGETAGTPGAGPSVTLELEIGQVEVPLSALEAWTPGSVVPLDLGSEEPAGVTVRLERQAVARGTLVRLEDRLAVQISEVLL